MQSTKTVQIFSRRAFTKFAAVTAATGIALAHQSNGLARSLAKDQAALTVYAFYPKEEGELTDCSACQNHGANKRFASLEAAKANRAHAGCRCAILSIPASEAEYVRMFGGSAEAVEREMYDLRWS